MKTKIITLMSAATLSLIPCLAHADDLSTNDLSLRDRDEATAQRSLNLEQLGDLKRANNIIGREILDDHDQVLGKIKDLALDLQNGRVAEVIVATSGALGMDQKLVAVPPAAFACDRTMKNVRFTADKMVLKNSPEFNASQWLESTQYIEVRETFQRFNVAPYFLHDQQAIALTPSSTHAVGDYYSFDGQKPLPQLGYITRATRLLGTTTMNSLDERLGKVDDFVLNLPAGRIVEVILSTGGFVGVDASLRAVPPGAFHWNTNNATLTLESTKEAFRMAPHFKSSEWGYALEPASIGDVYTAYHVQPYFMTRDMDPGAQNVRTQGENASHLYSTPEDDSTKQTK